MIVALGLHIGGCADDKGKTAAGDQATASGNATAKDAGTGEPHARAAAAGASGGDGLLTESTCLAGAHRASQASEACLDCVCKTVVACGAGCQQLLLCVFANCADSINDAGAVAACALRSCSAEAFAPGAAEGLSQAIGTLSACGPLCQPPMLPGGGPTEVQSGADSGVDREADAGL
jgi:hypothetical protein